MVEHLFCKQRVIGSIPVTSTIGRLGKLKYVEYFRQPERIERQPERQSVILNEVKNLNKIKDISLSLNRMGTLSGSLKGKLKE